MSWLKTYTESGSMIEGVPEIHLNDRFTLKYTRRLVKQNIFKTAPPSSR